MFTGVQTAFLDEEGRLNLPRSVSNGLDKEYRDRQLFVTSLDGESVKVFPLREWEVVEARLSDPSPEGNEPDGVLKDKKWGIHLTQVAPRRCGLVDPWTPAHCTQNAPWGARRRSAGNWATRLRFGPIKDYARAMAIAGLETWCYRQAFPGAANGQPQYVVVT